MYVAIGMGAPRNSLLSRYGVTLAACVLATLAAVFFHTMLQMTFFLFFCVAVFVSANLGGMGPGIVATLMSAAICDYLFLPPVPSFGMYPIYRTSFTLFICVGMLASLIGDRAYRARQRAEVAQEAAEAERKSLLLLVQTSELLETSFEAKVTLRSVARLITSSFADLCLIDYRTDLCQARPVDRPVDGTLDLADLGQTARCLAVSATDPASQLAMAELQRLYPKDCYRSEVGPGYVWSTGHQELVSDIASADIDAPHLRILQQFGYTSYMCVPILVREQVVGIITFAAASPHRAFRPKDLHTAVSLAHRVGVALYRTQAGIYAC